MYASRSGPPAWLVFLAGIALVFGLYYLYVGTRSYLESGGLSAVGATERALIEATSTANRQFDLSIELPTRRPTFTPVPPCQIFLVSVSSAVLRRQPTTTSEFLDNLVNGSEVCVVDSTTGADGFIWYLIDREPRTNRVDTAYMREDLITPRDPSPTPTQTPMPLATVTPPATRTPLPGIVTPVNLPGVPTVPARTPSDTDNGDISPGSDR